MHRRQFHPWLDTSGEGEQNQERAEMYITFNPVQQAVKDAMVVCLAAEDAEAILILLRLS